MMMMRDVNGQDTGDGLDDLGGLSHTTEGTGGLTQ